jgi:hypothetical protein
VRYVYVGDLERRAYDPSGLTRLRSALPVAYEKSDTFICIAPR